VFDATKLFLLYILYLIVVELVFTWI